MTKPRTETMWIAWHSKRKYIPQTGSKTKKGCVLLTKFYMNSPYWEQCVPIKVQIAEIQPKKRGSNGTK
jgi:hypothetical protein